MASNKTPRYDASKINYGAAYYSIASDDAIRVQFDGNGKIANDGDDNPVIRETLRIVRVGKFREPTGDVDRPVFQTDVLHAYTAAELKHFERAAKAAKCLNVTSVMAAKTETAAVSSIGF